MITFSNPWIGVIIPCIIIFTLSTFSAIYILPHHVSNNELTLFICASAMVWISYIIAIIVPPGSPPKNYTPPENGMKMYCLKCKAYKPERTHHSKALGVCVLKMDHHCPWTNNTVGHRNMPHFMRFLVWVDMTVGYLFIRLCIRIMKLWRDKHLPSYLFDKTEVILSIVFLPASFFVLFTVGILTIRVFVNMCNGITQIESWECDRIESLVRRKIVTEERAEFPYDIELFTNIFNAVGSPLTFWLPWGQPRGDGITFEKNESGYTEEGEPLCWPRTTWTTTLRMYLFRTSRTVFDDEVRSRIVFWEGLELERCRQKTISTNEITGETWRAKSWLILESNIPTFRRKVFIAYRKWIAMSESCACTVPLYGLSGVLL